MARVLDDACFRVDRAFAAIAVWSVFALLRDRGAAIRVGLNPAHAAGWLPIPLLPAALTAALAWRLGRGSLVAGAAAGAVFGLASQLIWPAGGPLGGPLAGMLLGAGFAALGVLAGSRLAGILEQPTARSCVALATVALVAPFASGAVDLFLRLRTP